jgi:hypothetical protein
MHQGQSLQNSHGRKIKNIAGGQGIFEAQARRSGKELQMHLQKARCLLWRKT